MLINSQWLEAKRAHVENLFEEAMKNQKKYNEIFNTSETICSEKFLLFGIPFFAWTIVKKEDFLKFKECFFNIHGENEALLAFLESVNE
jgi:hypothetical protein